MGINAVHTYRIVPNYYSNNRRTEAHNIPQESSDLYYNAQITPQSYEKYLIFANFSATFFQKSYIFTKIA